MMNGGDKNELNMNDSVYVAEFLPIISPKHKSKSTSHITTTLPYSSCTHRSATLLGSDAHLLGSGNNASEQNRREFMNEQPLMGMSSRWSPTPEQLLALEEMYRRGTRTPSAEQIQQIAAQLRRFGKIEGKNVFYWFQNHKARERQKRRRAGKFGLSSFLFDFWRCDFALELRRTVYEFEQKKTLVPPSSCSENTEGAVSMVRVGTTESTTPYGWPQFEERESHQNKSCSLEKNATWHAMDLYPSYPIQLINNMTTRSSRFLNSRRRSSWFRPSRRTENETNLDDENKIGGVETLDLFPLCSEDCNGVNGSKNDTKVPITAINTN
ncbi:hypothetical protein GH714_042125 [Hevea brasiliensis]|uniref:Homeobox domain-containing protein n=1 Tax=Hevea brasiliensis TaxID=3981 RepID=A0A6A6MUD3_HEVBR|nr:hypothetical protein GH714_042125 [Hevea brasiliensis]